MSDKEIVVQSSLLQYLLPGRCIDMTIFFNIEDIILAVRGVLCHAYARIAMDEI